MIRAQDLVRRYGQTIAVDGISFEIPQGEVVGFLGPNGAGKTTTLKILAGFLEPSAGKVFIAGRDSSTSSLDCRRHVGYLPENNPLYEEMGVSEYLEWAARMREVPPESRGPAIRGGVERCGLGAVLGREIGTLSKGYRQRLGLAGAMIHNPPVLLLDEPTSGLDPNQAMEVRGLIAELRKEKTVLLSTHILSEVRASCDRVIIIHKGKIAAQGSPKELEAGASQSHKLHLVLRSGGSQDKVLAELSAFSGVQSAQAQAKNGEIIFSMSVNSEAGDLRDRLFKFAVDKKWPVLELYRESVSLEEIFRNLTA